MFSEKLDFLMRLTGVGASTLGRSCRIDASYVSRLRNGTRRLPTKPVFLSDMSIYFAKHITEMNQRMALCSVLNATSWPKEQEAAAELIETWLTGESTTAPDFAPLLERFAKPDPPIIPACKETVALPKSKRYYYGDDGKKEAVLQFFNLILKESTPQTMLLFSDEEMSWLYDDPGFAAKWATSFMDVLLAGNRVKIIHNVGRNFSELLEAVGKWLPIYMTGMIEPYYYPKLRDGLLQRTLFLAPRTAAVVSVSIDRKTNGMLNELICDKNALSALKAEYDGLFSLCRPLMHIYTLSKRLELLKAYNALLAADGDMVCVSDKPTLATMPEWVAKAMQLRAPESSVYEQRELTSFYIGEHAKKGNYTEIIAAQKVCKAMPLSCADLLGAPGLCYTEDEWLAHLETAHSLAAAHTGYASNVSPNVPDDITLFAKENHGVIVVKNKAPGMAFAFSEGNMTAAFRDYLSRLSKG